MLSSITMPAAATILIVDDYPDALPGLMLERRRRFGETALSYYTCR